MSIEAHMPLESEIYGYVMKLFNQEQLRESSNRNHLFFKSVAFLRL